MADKQIKIWLSIFVFTLMTVGSAASYFAQGRVFYRGVRKQETVNIEQLYASILHTESENPEQAPELNFKAPEGGSAGTEANVIPADGTVIPAQAGILPVSSPCTAGEKPIIKNGQVNGCTNNNVSLRAQRSNLAGPKVRILTEPSPIYLLSPATSYNLPPTTYNLTSCESQNLFTYTGPDRPGLLYGMCIECESSQYIINEGCALRAH